MLPRNLTDKLSSTWLMCAMNKRLVFREGYTFKHYAVVVSKIDESTRASSGKHKGRRYHNGHHNITALSAFSLIAFHLLY